MINSVLSLITMLAHNYVLVRIRLDKPQLNLEIDPKLASVWYVCVVKEQIKVKVVIATTNLDSWMSKQLSVC